jgi:hypothetical protein
MFLERVEVVVAVEEGMPLGQTESGDQAVNHQSLLHDQGRQSAPVHHMHLLVHNQVAQYLALPQALRWPSFTGG